MRKTILGLSAVVCLLFAGAARADVIYTLDLTSTSGNAGNGIGSLEVATVDDPTAPWVKEFNQLVASILPGSEGQITIFGVLISDVALAFLDPRIRLHGSSR